MNKTLQKLKLKKLKETYLGNLLFLYTTIFSMFVGHSFLFQLLNVRKINLINGRLKIYKTKETTLVPCRVKSLLIKVKILSPACPA